MLTTFLTPNSKQTVQFAHILMLGAHARMNVPIQSNVYAGMSENLTQRLNVEPCLYTSSRKSVAKGVELCLLKSASLEDSLEAIFHCPRLNEFALLTTQNIGISAIG